MVSAAWSEITGWWCSDDVEELAGVKELNQWEYEGRYVIGYGVLYYIPREAVRPLTEAEAERYSKKVVCAPWGRFSYTKEELLNQVEVSG